MRLAIGIFARPGAGLRGISGTAVSAGPVARRAVLSPAAIAGERRGGTLPVEVSEDAEEKGEKEDGHARS